MAPGRVVPNDMTILSDEERQIRDVSEGLPTDGFLMERSGKV